MSLVAWYPLNGNLKDNCGRYNLNTNYLYGDVNQDGSITQEDADLIKSFIIETATPTDNQKIIADINKDGELSLNDYALVNAYVKNTNTSSAVGEYSNVQRFNPTWVDGKTGRYALKINQDKFATNWVTIEQLRNKPLGFSVSLWVKQDTPVVDFKDLIDFETYKETDNTTGILRLESTTTPQLRWFNNGHLSTTSGYVALGGTNNVTLNEWIHLTAVFKTNGLEFYKNGKHVQSWGYQLSPEGITLTGKFRIGNPSESSYCNSTISNIKIYNHCLSKEEVYQDYLSPMLHYTFENPYVEETENIPHSLQSTHSSYVVLGNDAKGNYFTLSGTPSTSGNINVAEGWFGLAISSIPIKSGEYYTWSLEVNPEEDTQYVFDNNVYCQNSSHTENDGDHFTIIGGYSHAGLIDNPDRKGILSKNTWTRIFITIKVKQECTNPTLSTTFCPYLQTGKTSLKIYYRNSMLEQKDHMSPYAKTKRLQSLIRDNSGQGNDGRAIYRREEIPIIGNSEGKTFTKSDFKGITNEYLSIGYMNHDSKYHYLGSTLCYEFDITLNNIVTTGTAYFHNGGYTEKTDGTLYWSPGRRRTSTIYWLYI